MEEFPQNVAGREIHRFRNLRDLTQEALATALQVQGWDISRGTLAKIESGIRCVTDMEVVVMAKVLGCTPNDLLSRNFKECLQLIQSSKDSKK